MVGGSGVVPWQGGVPTRVPYSDCAALILDLCDLHNATSGRVAVDSYKSNKGLKQRADCVL